MSSVKICCVVVTYYPDVKDSTENILRYIKEIDHLIIWENTPLSEQHKYKIELPGYEDKYSYMGNGENVGIAYALNRSVEWCKEHGYTHLMTMDQDSKWENFTAYREGVIRNAADPKTGLFTPKIIHSISRRAIPINLGIITSGSIVPVEICMRVGGFQEEYIIDCVDYEYYYRILSQGYDYKVIEEGVLVQEFGAQKKAKYFNYYTINHSAYRLYHITRNGIWLWHDYRDKQVLPKEWRLKELLKRNVKRDIKILLGESDKCSKMAAVLKGYRDGFFGKRVGHSGITRS